MIFLSQSFSAANIGILVEIPSLLWQDFSEIKTFSYKSLKNRTFPSFFSTMFAKTRPLFVTLPTK